MSTEAVGTETILAAIRTELGTISGANVSPQLGDRASAARKHQYVEILDVDTSEPFDGDHQQTNIWCERRIRLRWWYAIRSDRNESDAITFARSIRQKLVGDTTFAHRYKMTFGGEPVAIRRDGGFYTGEQEFVSTRGLPTGS